MIEQNQIYGIAAVLLFCVGLHGVATRPEMVRKVIALNIMGAGVFLFLISVAWQGARAPADPVPQAMVLTGIVVAVSASAFALGLVRRLAGLAEESAAEHGESPAAPPKEDPK